MATIDVLLPQFGMGMSEGEILKWHKSVGDRIAKGDILLEVEAEKANVEVPSAYDGTIVAILAQEGDLVEVRSVIARIEQA
jgi:pyruvate/2-oxoglutarate dehydrogenase complex dihydrolipoamide acyltransferase (E2) component